MKKLFCFLLALLLTPSILGCTQKQTDEDNITFYYRSIEVQYGKTSGVILSEDRAFPAGEQNYKVILTEYLEGPLSENLESPFPVGLTLVDFNKNNNIATLTLSDHMSRQTGANLTLSCACIAKTVFGLVDISAVCIQAENSLLDGKEKLIFDRRSFSYNEKTT